QDPSAATSKPAGGRRFSLVPETATTAGGFHPIDDPVVLGGLMWLLNQSNNLPQVSPRPPAWLSPGHGPVLAASMARKDLRLPGRRIRSISQGNEDAGENSWMHEHWALMQRR
ncbi:unnamed protein product, partial [Dibothriocephalus latus]